MRKIAVSLSKGGVGKSTSAVNLAHGLATEGKRVLLIDTDTQGQCSRILGVSPEKGLAELLLDDAKPTDVLTEARENLWLLAGSRTLAQAKRAIAQREFKSEEVLTEALEAYAGYFEYVILDTAPGWDSLSVNVIFYAEEILCPVSLEALSIDGLVGFLASVEPIQKYKPVEIKYVLPTFLDGRVKKSTEILDQLHEHFGDRVCNAIHYSVKVSEASGLGKTIFEYAPKDRGAIDYAKLVGRVSRG